jgi:hypothetical protein
MELQDVVIAEAAGAAVPSSLQIRGGFAVILGHGNCRSQVDHIAELPRPTGRDNCHYVVATLAQFLLQVAWVVSLRHKNVAMSVMSVTEVGQTLRQAHRIRRTIWGERSFG